MIDISSLVFDTAYTQLSQSYPEANITAGYDEKKAGAINVIIREVGNVPYANGNTDDCAENFSRITFEVDVECNNQDTARSECDAILDAADAVMQSMKFRRIYMSGAVNLERTTYRKYARYEVIVGKPVTYDKGTQNERTVYQMYRR